jgi:hypothetical protein
MSDGAYIEAEVLSASLTIEREIIDNYTMGEVMRTHSVVLDEKRDMSLELGDSTMFFPPSVLTEAEEVEAPETGERIRMIRFRRRDNEGGD